MSSFETPRKVKDEESTSEKEWTPLKSTVDTVNFPPGIKRKRHYYPAEGSYTLAVIAENTSVKQYDEIVERNKDIEPLFIFMGGALYLEDPEVANSPIHEYGHQFFSEAITDYNRRARLAFPNLPKRIIYNAGQHGHKNGNFGAMPDIGISAGVRTADECNVIVEISYGVGLSKTADKIVHYFTEFVGINEALIIDIFYEWDYDVLDNGSRIYNRNNGKMVCYHYRRVDFIVGQPVKPSHALSFGDNPINPDDVNDTMVSTGINQQDIHGNGIGDDLPCDHEGMALYEVVISGRALLSADPNDPDGQCITGHYLNQLPEEFDLHLDLFEFKELLVGGGLNAMDNKYRVATLAL